MSDKKLDAYIKAINKIDDYFEYRCKSKEDQKKVYEILKELTDTLVKGMTDKEKLRGIPEGGL